jgi:hypothetical protein
VCVKGASATRRGYWRLAGGQGRWHLTKRGLTQEWTRGQGRAVTLSRKRQIHTQGATLPRSPHRTKNTHTHTLSLVASAGELPRAGATALSAASPKPTAASAAAIARPSTALELSSQ